MPDTRFSLPTIFAVVSLSTVAQLCLVGTAMAREWNVDGAGTVSGDFVSCSNTVVELSDNKKVPYHRLSKEDQDFVRKKLVLAGNNNALGELQRGEREVREFVHAVRNIRMQARFLGVSKRGRILVENSSKVYEFTLAQFSPEDEKYIRNEASLAGQSGLLPKERQRASRPNQPTAGGGSVFRQDNGLQAPNGDAPSLPPTNDNTRRDDLLDENGRLPDGYPGRDGNEGGGATYTPPRFAGRNKVFEPPPANGPMVREFGPAGGNGAGRRGDGPVDGTKRTNDLQGLDGVEFGREELPPIVVNPGDPGYEEMKEAEEAKMHQLFPEDRPKKKKQGPLFNDMPGDVKPSIPSGSAPAASVSSKDESIQQSPVPDTGTPSPNSLVLGILFGAGGVLLLIGGVGLGFLLGKK